MLFATAVHPLEIRNDFSLFDSFPKTSVTACRFGTLLHQVVNRSESRASNRGTKPTVAVVGRELGSGKEVDGLAL